MPTVNDALEFLREAVGMQGADAVNVLENELVRLDDELSAASDRNVTMLSANMEIGQEFEWLREAWETFRRDPTSAQADAITALFAAVGTQTQRERMVTAIARALYAATFQQSIDESQDVAEAWRVWRAEAQAILDGAVREGAD